MELLPRQAYEHASASEKLFGARSIREPLLPPTLVAIEYILHRIPTSLSKSIHYRMLPSMITYV